MVGLLDDRDDLDLGEGGLPAALVVERGRPEREAQGGGCSITPCRARRKPSLARALRMRICACASKRSAALYARPPSTIERTTGCIEAENADTAERSTAASGAAASSRGAMKARSAAVRSATNGPP